MDERDDEPRADRPEPDDPTAEAPASEDRPQPEEPTAEAPASASADRPQPEEPAAEASASADRPQPEEPATEAPTSAHDPTGETDTSSHEPASSGPPGGHPPGGDSAADALDGGAAEPDRPRRLYRSRRDRLMAGVCGGLADYFGIEALIVRVVAVLLVFAGGAGIFLYIGAWLLVPEEGRDDERPVGRMATVAGVVALALAVATLVPFWGGPFGGWGWGGPIMSIVCIGVAGLAVWWLASGDRPAGGAADVMRRAGLGVALLALSALLAFGGAWATAFGGGTVVAVIVIVAGLWLAASAFLGGSRWLIVPALALALPAAVVSAANIDADGGVGEREYRPVAVQDVRDEYRIGMGRLVVDLRDADLPPGDHRVALDVGLGEAWVVVPEDVCVTSRADLGAGEVVVFNRDVGGVDVDWEDSRRAPADTARLVLDSEIGMGALHVSHEHPDSREWRFGRDALGPGNGACIGGARG